MEICADSISIFSFNEFKFLSIPFKVFPKRILLSRVSSFINTHIQYLYFPLSDSKLLSSIISLFISSKYEKGVIFSCCSSSFSLFPSPFWLSFSFSFSSFSSLFLFAWLSLCTWLCWIDSSFCPSSFSPLSDINNYILYIFKNFK